jgi:hypothetical protein
LHYKSTVARLLITSAIAFTSFSIQEAWATKKLFEEENSLKINGTL